MKAKLSKSMTVAQFQNGYWYASELKEFAEQIGVPSANKLRKDELETAIITFLKSGKIETPTKRSLIRSGIKDVEKGLTLELRIVNYTSNRETKDFIVSEARKLVPNLKRKSGARYRLNRWREEQLTNGRKITYKDLVNEYIRLNQSKAPFARVPHDRYVYFMSDFLKSESGATREEAIRAWEELKKMDVPKTYEEWARLKRKKS